MPERTDWQALDRRIAREVMGWQLRPLFYDYGRCSTMRWVTNEVDFTGFFPPLGYEPEWQPHQNVTQALMAADKICDQGWDRELTRLASGEKRYASFWKYRPVGPDEYSGVAETDAKAMSLAIEAWLDAQKKLQDAQED